MIGVPALWPLLHRRITQELAAKPGVVEGAFKALMKGNAALRDSALGREPRASSSSGRSTGSSAAGCGSSSPAARRSIPEVQKAFHELGFNLYEGYGLTEAAPVLTVSKPGGDRAAGQRRAGAARASSSGSPTPTRAASARCSRAAPT